VPSRRSTRISTRRKSPRSISSCSRPASSTCARDAFAGASGPSSPSTHPARSLGAPHRGSRRPRHAIVPIPGCGPRCIGS
jgi:hypothetical protein